MAYSTLEDLQKFMETTAIVQLSDDNNTGEIDSLVIDDVIAQADTFIDGFCRGRYPVEMEAEDVPDLISDISTKLAAYNLYRRKLITTLPEPIKDGYKFCVKMLEKIQDGSISPWPEVNEPQVIKTNKTAADKTYTKAVWDTY